MMGLLDNIGKQGLLDDPQNAGLLAAAFGLLSASGPSTTPTSLGSALGNAGMAGMNAYNQSRQSQVDRTLKMLQARDMEMGLRQKQAAIDKQQRLEDAYAAYNQPQSTTDTVTAALSQGGGPTIENAAKLAGTTQPAANNASLDNYTRHLQFAKYLEGRQLYKEAQEYYDLAEKFRPKYSTTLQPGKDASGVLRNYLVADNGTTKQADIGVKPDLHAVDLGGKLVMVDKNAATNGQSFTKSMTPGEIATDKRARERLAFDQRQASKLQHVQIDGQPMTFNPVTGQYAPGVGPEGKALPTVQKPLTEAQSKDNVYAQRMDQADRILTQLSAQGVDRPGNIKQTVESAFRAVAPTENLGNTWSGVAGSLSNWTQSPNQNKVENAQRNFRLAVLRKESGAAVSPQEHDETNRLYFPQVGDPPDVIAQKARNRRVAINAITAGVPGGPRGATNDDIDMDSINNEIARRAGGGPLMDAIDAELLRRRGGQ